MTEDQGFLNWLVTTIIGSGGLFICWLMNRSITRLDTDISTHSDRLNEHDEKHQTCSLELANFKTEVANNYAKDASVQSSLGRIHDRIDEVSKDIKTLLSKGK